MTEIFIIVLALFFSVNMGASIFGVTFAAACGSKAITPKRAQCLFALCVVAGALCLGREVTNTLEGGIIPAFIITPKVCIIIFFSAVLRIFISNILHVPQSTSLVTVAALMGVGLYFDQVEWENILWMLPFWIFLPVAGYFLTYFIGKMIYPPRKINFWIYEKLVNHKSRLKAFVVLSSCYNAFSVGTNNVANVVGPLVGSEMIRPVIGLLVMAPFFGVGSVLFPGALKTSSEKIIPLGLLSASIICLVCGTLVIIASVCGVPQSFVMVKVAAIFAIASLKDESGHGHTFKKPLSKKVIYNWILMPILAMVIAYVLTWLLFQH